MGARFRVDPAAMADMAEAVAALRTLIGESVEQGRDGQNKMAAAWEGRTATSAVEATGKWATSTGELGEMFGKIVDYLHGARGGYVQATKSNADMWSAGGGTQLDVDPLQLAASGKAVDTAADGLRAAAQALSGARLSFNAGQDDAGENFGEQYTASARQIVEALFQTLGAASSVGHGIGVSAANYALADAAATIPQASPSVSMPAKPHHPKISVSISNANGGGVMAPALWSVVEFFVGDVWPNGDPSGAREVAAPWKALWQALPRVAAQMQAAKAGISAQTMPEAQTIGKAIDTITSSLTQLAQLSGKLASELEGFADQVQHAQDSVRDLLRRLSPSNVLDTLGDFLFHGESPLEEIKAVARDIKGVLDNHGNQVEARKSDLLGIGAQIDAAKDAIKDWVSKEFPSAAPVINALVSMDAGALKNITGMFTGPLAYVAGLDPTRFGYDTQGAQQAWGGLAKTVGSALDPVGTTAREIAKLVSDPGGQTDKTLETVKALVDWEDVKKGDPWEAVGYNLTTAATFLVPGGGAARAATVGTDAARVGEGVANAEIKTATALGREAAAVNPVAEVSAQTGKITETLGKLPDGINPGELKIGPASDIHPPTATISEPKPGAIEHPAVPAAETKPTIAQPVSEGSGVPVQAEHHGTPALERPEPRPADDAALLSHNGAPAYGEAPGHGVPAAAERPVPVGERATEPALAGPAEHAPAASSTHPTPPDRPGPGPSETTTPQFADHTPAPADHPPGERPAAPGDHGAPPGERPLAPGERPIEQETLRTPAHPGETPRPVDGPLPPERAPTPHNALPEHGEPVPAAHTPATGEHTPPATPTGPSAPAGPTAPAHPTSPTTPHAPSTPAAHGEPVKQSTITPLREPIREPVVPNRPLHEPSAPVESKPSLAKTTPGEATPAAARAHEPAPAERSAANGRPGPERPAEPAPAAGRGHDGGEPPKPPADNSALLGAHGERPEWAQKVLDGQSERSVESARLNDDEFARHKELVADKVRQALSDGLSTDQQHLLHDRMEWTAERQSLHKQLVNDLWERLGADKVPNDHRALVAGGLPGAGKTTTLSEFAGIRDGEYLVINPDDVKSLMAERGLVPKVEGLSPMEASTLVHEESSVIAKNLADRAMAEGKNIMWDITMGSPSGVESRLTSLREMGYTKIDSVFVDIPLETSMERVADRFRRGVDDYLNGAGYGGRFVPEDISTSLASEKYYSRNREVLEALRDQFDNVQVWDNSRAGLPPRRVQ
ncbi:Zeta toxin [Mycobacteroides salmoniphilum]|uniref:UDP-N-acetylglucosamine kinase n=1 Tax=Mycobacteroides salmoniphilum TaxID=404941 RepID=A0A4R8RTJ5_9MYCO|nr:zeta toxin family protein [Mycobacteroides salmoniphilum]TDZ77354.1 Zeta toxin [Mycobacteroides salmoniphilum]